MTQQGRIAIFLRGYHRMWHLSNPHIFNTFESIYGAENIDWYVLFWKTSTTDLKKLRDTFAGKNIIYCNLIDEAVYPIPRDIEVESDVPWRAYRPYYWRPAYLDSLLIMEKCKTELQHGVLYDTVIFARSDVIYCCTDIENERIPLQPFYYSNLENEFCNDQHYDICADDVYYKADSISADIIASRFLDTFTTGIISTSAHSLVASYVNRNQLLLKNNPNMIPLIIRPDTLDLLELTTFDDKRKRQEYHREVAWSRESAQYRRQLCISTGIDPIEYYYVNNS